MPAVRGTNVGRGKQTPLRIEPEVGKVGADVRQTSPNKSGDVLQEHESRSHISQDPGNVWPEPSLVIDTETLPRRREWLTVETGSDDIHSATPRFTVERGDIIPDRRLIQGLFFHPRHESGRCVTVPLNTSHGTYVEAGEPESELESSVSVEEAEGT